MKESRFMKGVVAAVATIAFSMPAIASAQVGTGVKGKSEKVSYSDLDIEKNEGARQLYRRLQHASKRVCGVESLKVAGSIAEVSQSRRCYRETLDAAVAKMDNSALTELHKG